MLNFWRLVWRPDLLHIQGYTSNLLFVIDWAYGKIPVVYEEHQTPDARFDWWQGFQTSVNKSTVVVAVSEKSAQALRTVCNITRPIEVRSPLLADPIADGWNGSRSPREPHHPVSVTTVARLSVAKGLDYLLEAIVRVRAQHPATDFKVFGEGSLRQELLDKAGSLGLDGNAIFVGAFTSRKELTRILSQTDIFVLPSILEGQPLALVEAMAHGCALVSTSVGGIPELIRDGVNGLLCEPGDPVCLAQKITELIEDTAARSRLGDAARKSYEKGPYQPAAVSDELISIYGKALSYP
jgi:glycosyltransferase involved in cell wall biosynthesis